MITTYTRADYFTDLVKRIDAVGRKQRVDLATMDFDATLPNIATVMRALCAAAARGAHVHLAVDAHTFLQVEASLGPLFFRNRLITWRPNHFSHQLDALEQLRHSGGTYTITNRPKRAFSNPVAGRSHIKYARVGDYSYIGGSNLSSNTHADLMVGFRNPVFASWLGDIATRTATHADMHQVFNNQDDTLVLDAATSIITDAGVPRQSRIFDAALRLIDAAEHELFLTCQYFPNSTTGHHLAAAHKRGVRVTIIYNHYAKHTFPLSVGHWASETLERIRLPRELFVHRLHPDNPYIHAKLLTSEKAVMIGSHNYVTAGVRLGTAEIALQSTNQDLARRATATLQSQLLH